MNFNTNISIKQIVKVTDKNGEEQFFVMDDDENKWVEITQSDYNKIWGRENEQ